MNAFYRNQCGNRAQIEEIFTAKIAVPYIYLPSVSVFAVASRLLLGRFQSLCSASGPSTSKRDLKSHYANSSNARRAVGERLVPAALPVAAIAMLVAAKSLPVAEGFREGFAKAFRTVPPTVTQTVSVTQ